MRRIKPKYTNKSAANMFALARVVKRVSVGRRLSSFSAAEAEALVRSNPKWMFMWTAIYMHLIGEPFEYPRSVYSAVIRGLNK